MFGCACITDATDLSIEPRCTGVCGAFAIKSPLLSKTAQEKSNRSLMFTERAVYCNLTPICSAIDINKLLNTSSKIGSACVRVANVLFVLCLQDRMIQPLSSSAACHPG